MRMSSAISCAMAGQNVRGGGVNLIFSYKEVIEVRMAHMGGEQWQKFHNFALIHTGFFSFENSNSRNVRGGGGCSCFSFGVANHSKFEAVIGNFGCIPF